MTSREEARKMWSFITE